MNYRNFLAELKRRNVIRAAILYLGAVGVGFKMVKRKVISRSVCYIGRPLFVFIWCSGLFGCTSIPTTERMLISRAEWNAIPSPNEAFNLSMHERKVCAKKAAEGDIVAARTLAKFHMAVTGDEERFQYWLSVVARLEKAGPKKGQ